MSNAEADYIIVGGGLTRCAVAARLQQDDPSLQILVLEAGVDAPNNRKSKTLQELSLLQGLSSITTIRAHLNPTLMAVLIPLPGEKYSAEEAF